MATATAVLAPSFLRPKKTAGKPAKPPSVNDQQLSAIVPSAAGLTPKQSVAGDTKQRLEDTPGDADRCSGWCKGRLSQRPIPNGLSRMLGAILSAHNGSEGYGCNADDSGREFIHGSVHV